MKKSDVQGFVSVATCLIVLSFASFTAIYFEGTTLVNIFAKLVGFEYMYSHLWVWLVFMTILLPIMFFTIWGISIVYFKTIRKTKSAWLNTSFA